MNRLHSYMLNAGKCVNFPDDVSRLKEQIPQIAIIPDSLVEKMYADFSDTYAAGWLIVDDESINDFRRWLEI